MIFMTSLQTSGKNVALGSKYHHPLHRATTFEISSLTWVDGRESRIVPPFFPIVAPILLLQCVQRTQSYDEYILWPTAWREICGGWYGTGGARWCGRRYGTVVLAAAVKDTEETSWTSKLFHMQPIITTPHYMKQINIFTIFMHRPHYLLHIYMLL